MAVGLIIIVFEVDFLKILFRCGKLLPLIVPPYIIMVPLLMIPLPRPSMLLLFLISVPG